MLRLSLRAIRQHPARFALTTFAVVLGAFLYVTLVYALWRAAGRPAGAETFVASQLRTAFQASRPNPGR